MAILFYYRNEIEVAVSEQDAVRSYLDDVLNRQYSEQCYESTEADWKYTTNITSENEKIKVIFVDLNGTNIVLL